MEPLAGTFHRRVLKEPSIQFSSDAGRALFSEALVDGNMTLYFSLAEVYQTQGHPAFCGLGSLTMVLNALLLDPKRVWGQSVWRWFDESMLSCCEKLETIREKGITLPKLNCLARCQGAQSILKYASDISIEEFRRDLTESCKQSLYTEIVEEGKCTCREPKKSIIIASYSRKVLNQTGTGHFSPLGGYHEGSDMVLIMDVARFKHPPHWTPLQTLFAAMQSVDKETGRSRGYMLVLSSNELAQKCEALCCSPSALNEDENVCEQEGALEEGESAADVDSVINANLDQLINHNCSMCEEKSCGI